MKLFRLMMVCMMVLILGACVGTGGVSNKRLAATPVRGMDALHLHLGASTVALVMIGKDDKIHSYCTGVWISDNEILTAGHCVAHDEESEESPVGNKVHYIVQKEVEGVTDEPSAIHLGEVNGFDKEHDLAVVKGIASGIPDHETASYAVEMPGLGERVYMVGHPRGLYWSFMEGTISAYRDTNDTSVGPVVQVNASVWYGNSGGGVFDGSGNLVGVCSSLTKVPGMSLFIHLDSVKNFIESVHNPVDSSIK